MLCIDTDICSIDWPVRQDSIKPDNMILHKMMFQQS